MSVYDGLESLNLQSDLQSFDSAESSLFREFVDEIKPKVVFDVGAWKGVSALRWAECGKPYGTHVHSVDTFLGSIEHFIMEPTLVPRDPWGAPVLYHQFLVNVKNAGYADAITPHVMTSRDGAKWLAHSGVRAQIISLDADHSFTGLYEDMNNYWPLLEAGGLMVGDDIEFPSVYAAAVRFAVENNLNLEIKKPFWVIRKPGALWPADYNLDRNHCREVFNGEYDLPLEKPGMRILDLGANVGAFARWAKQRWPDSTINCYEPHPVNFFLLKRTVKDFKLQGVEIHEVAVAAEAGQQTFYHNGPNCGEWSLAKNASTHNEMTVQTMAAKDLPEADFIKLDIEGMEPEVLMEIIKSGKMDGVSGVALEYHASTMIGPIQGLLLQQGFKLMEFRRFMEHRGILKFLRCSA